MKLGRCSACARKHLLAALAAAVVPLRGSGAPIGSLSSPLAMLGQAKILREEASIPEYSDHAALSEGLLAYLESTGETPGSIFYPRSLRSVRLLEAPFDGVPDEALFLGHIAEAVREGGLDTVDMSMCWTPKAFIEKFDDLMKAVDAPDAREKGEN